MVRRRFFASPDAFQKDTVTLTGDEARHLRSVLRLKPGDEVFVFDGAGNEFVCSVAGFGRDEAKLENCRQTDPFKPESPLDLCLAVALLKGEKFDLVVQKLTELGIKSIIPVTTKFADIHLRDASEAEKRVTRWRRIAMEAAKQSGRALVPYIDGPRGFDSILQIDSDLRLMFSERDGKPIANELPSKQRPLSITALVGSEGGWADEEIAKARDSGWQIVTLGGRVLRAETAAITVCVLLQHSFGDLQ